MFGFIRQWRPTKVVERDRRDDARTGTSSHRFDTEEEGGHHVTIRTFRKATIAAAGLLAAGVLLWSGGALAADAPAPAAAKVDTGDTSWLLTSSALGLLMTPGLAFFYGGLVRKKNMLSVLMQCF